MVIEKIELNLQQTYAIIAKNVKLKLRFKVNFILQIISPLWAFVMPMIILGKIFEIAKGEPLGIWTSETFFFFVLSGFCIGLAARFVHEYHKILRHEKYWKTLPAIFISPLNKYNLLIAIFIEQLVYICIPLTIVFIILLIIYPTTAFSFCLAILIFFGGCVVLASIGLIIGSFSLSAESAMQWVAFLMHFILMFSCYNYPKEIFPPYLLFLIFLNPLYYYWDLMRVIWLFGLDYVLFNPAYIIHIIIVISFTIFSPILSVIIFNFFYKKYGVSGY
ncbi:MAG: ABC transporter permease [Promethearchaeota archaeon]